MKWENFCTKHKINYTEICPGCDGEKMAQESINKMNNIKFEERLRQILANVPDKNKARKIKNLILNQLPKKKEPSPYQNSDDYVRGWNDCLDEIRGVL